MTSTYGSDEKNLKYVDLPDDTLLSMGRLVRAFADYEELITLFIAAMANVTPSQAFIMLGKAGISTRLKMAEQLIKITPGKDVKRFNAAFVNSTFKDAHICRNAVAHGTYLGMDDDGMLAFLTDRSDDPVGQSTIQLVVCYSPETIRGISIAATQNVKISAEILGLQSWLSRHQPQTLHPHKKAQPHRSHDDK